MSQAADTSGLSALEKRQSSRLVIVLALIGGFFFVELVGAKLAKSDVLEADAFHLLMDVFALGISLGAMRLAVRSPSARFTYGLRRAEPIAALANGVLVLGVVVELIRDAVEHLGSDIVPRSGLMLAVATAALVVNVLNAWLLHGAMGHHGHSHSHGGHGHGHEHDEHGHAGHSRAGHSHAGHSHDEHSHEGHAHARAPAAHAHADGHGHDHGHSHGRGDSHGGGQELNLRGVWLHLLGDVLGSLAAFIAGLAIRFGATPKVDPIASFVVVAILIVGAVRLLRDALLVVIHAAPLHLPVDKVTRVLMGVDGIARVTSLHVWSLGTGHDVITAHVRASSADPGLPARATAALKGQFGVEYVTIQVDPE
jgi:cation diffusion facilitator family transporter